MADESTCEVPAVSVPQAVINNAEADLRLAVAILSRHGDAGTASAICETLDQLGGYSNWDREDV